jgi:cyclopropane fatty-acyl-phospholipid synthase-like methyltransferase
LELGCGLGYFSEYMENQGIKATGIDFSSVAIERAKKRTSEKECKPTYIVDDVTNLKLNDNQYDVIFDIGCLHCLNEDDSNKYAINVHRVLKQDGTLLIWSLRKSFTDMYMTPEFIEKIFEGKLTLEKTEFSRRRIIASIWFWLKKK